MVFRSVSVQLCRCVATVAAAALLAAVPAHAQVAIQADQTDVAEDRGNGNGWLDPGERFTLAQWVHSVEPSTLTGVSGVLSGDPAVTVSVSQASWPDLVFGIPTANATPFAGAVSAAAECGVPLPMQVALSTSGGPATVPVGLTTGTAGPFAAYDAIDLPRAIPDGGTVSSTLSVPSAGRIKALRVRIGELDHTYDADLRLVLVAPDGTSVVLAEGNGGSGDNFVGTVFDATATTRIGSGRAPFTGTFRPRGDLRTLVGRQLQGDWQLQVTDMSPANWGALVAWGVDASVALCDPVSANQPAGFAQRSDRAQGQWPDPPGWDRRPATPPGRG